MKLQSKGQLEEYLEKEPNFLHSLLSDSRVTDEQVGVIIFDLLGAGIDSVSTLFNFFILQFHNVIIIKIIVFPPSDIQKVTLADFGYPGSLVLLQQTHFKLFGFPCISR